MKVRLISVVALAVTTSAGISNGQDTMGSGPTQAAMQSPETDNFAPMTRSERVRAYLLGTFGRKALAGSAMHAEIGQLTHDPKEWGGNPAGYGARFGSAFAQHIIRGTLQYGASALLHEDNRYLASGKKGFWKRTEYAVSSTFLARRDNGRRCFAFARIGSAGGAAFIARVWLPRSVATASAGASSFGLTIAYDVGSNMLREFWPDLKRHFRRQ